MTVGVVVIPGRRVVALITNLAAIVIVILAVAAVVAEAATRRHMNVVNFGLGWRGWRGRWLNEDGNGLWRGHGKPRCRFDGKRPWCGRDYDARFARPHGDDFARAPVGGGGAGVLARAADDAAVGDVFFLVLIFANLDQAHSMRLSR